MKYTLILILITLAAVAFVACTPKANNGGDTSNDSKNRVSFQTLANESNSGVEKAQNVVVNDDKSLDKLWDDTYQFQDPKPPMPPVNFNTETVAGAYMGMRNSGGFGIEVTKIVDAGNEYQVFVKQIEPPKGSIVTMALTQPFHLVKFDNPEKKKVVFK